MATPDAEVPYGTLDLMVLKTLAAMGPLHGFGIARRIEQIADGAFALNQGTIYPALLRLEQKGWITSEWGTSENNRRARFYAITRAGQKAAGRRDRELGAHRGDGQAHARGRIMRAWLARVAGLFRGRGRDAELRQEMDTHLALHGR